MNEDLFTDIKKDVQASIDAEWNIDDTIESAFEFLIGYLQDTLSEEALVEVEEVLYD